ncbi:MAG TPA: hypothetical protein VHO69_02630 [Phototrophicaceae bacterium]|nr:hypothetical protein [Phototrophicaceae bacterium]
MAKKEAIQFYTEVGGKALIDHIRTYEKGIGRYDRRYGGRRRNTPWFAPGEVQRVVTYERGLRFQCQRGWVEVRWMAADCLRVRWLRQNDETFLEPFSYTVNKVDWPVVATEITEHDDMLIIQSSELVCRIGRRPFRVAVETLDGQPISFDLPGMQAREDGMVRLSLVLQPDETSYGLGERAFGLQLRGNCLHLWNTDAPVYQRGT